MELGQEPPAQHTPRVSLLPDRRPFPAAVPALEVGAVSAAPAAADPTLRVPTSNDGDGMGGGVSSGVVVAVVVVVYYRRHI